MCCFFFSTRHLLKPFTDTARIFVTNCNRGRRTRDHLANSWSSRIPGHQISSGVAKKLHAQSNRKLNLWQGCHEIAEESSKIVPLGAPLSPALSYAAFPESIGTTFCSQVAQQAKNLDLPFRTIPAATLRRSATPSRRNRYPFDVEQFLKQVNALALDSFGTIP